MDTHQSNRFDIAIVGAGFAGMYALKRALDSGRSAIVFDVVMMSEAPVLESLSRRSL